MCTHIPLEGWTLLPIYLNKGNEEWDTFTHYLCVFHQIWRSYLSSTLLKLYIKALFNSLKYLFVTNSKSLWSLNKYVSKWRQLCMLPVLGNCGDEDELKQTIITQKELVDDYTWHEDINNQTYKTFQFKPLHHVRGQVFNRSSTKLNYKHTFILAIA